MDQLSFEEFLATSQLKIPLIKFIINIIITAILTSILNYTYNKFGSSISNRKIFGKNFIIIGMCTMLIVSIIKSSLALSLGLVGALSIIRFRTAIKEPEELSYLFLCIAIGLGMGADQGIITMLAFVIIVSVIIFKNRFKPE